MTELRHMVGIEPPRRCGNRVIGKLYLVTDGMVFLCDRPLIEILPCPCCGEMPRAHRGITQFNFFKLYGGHIPEEECEDFKGCFFCHPTDVVNTYLMWVGDDYTIASFDKEVIELGVSKAIPEIPIDMVLGESWVLLAKRNVGITVTGTTAKGKEKRADVIFYAFKPSRVEMLITEKQAKDEEFVKDLQERGITPLVVPEEYEDAHRKRFPKEPEETTNKKLQDFVEE